MKAIDKKALVERAKREKRRQRANFNFDEDAYGPFVAKCEKDGVSVTRVLEELMKLYVGS